MQSRKSVNPGFYSLRASRCYHRDSRSDTYDQKGRLFMRLGYFTMPMHPAHRPPAQTLQEDREAIILADKLGFYDAFVGEHLTEKSENVTNSFIFLASVIHATQNIKLATGTSNLSHSHPTLI